MAKGLRVYGVGGHLLKGFRSSYENASASVCVNGELSESFSGEVGMRQGCMMSHGCSISIWTDA